MEQGMAAQGIVVVALLSVPYLCCIRHTLDHRIVKYFLKELDMHCTQSPPTHSCFENPALDPIQPV